MNDSGGAGWGGVSLAGMPAAERAARLEKVEAATLASGLAELRRGAAERDALDSLGDVEEAVREELRAGTARRVLARYRSFVERWEGV